MHDCKYITVICAATEAPVSISFTLLRLIVTGQQQFCALYFKELCDAYVHPVPRFHIVDQAGKLSNPKETTFIASSPPTQIHHCYAVLPLGKGFNPPNGQWTIPKLTRFYIG